MSAVREAELYSLPEVSRATGIPLPDLQRLRRDHAEAVPSVVVGEAKRYPDEALAVFRRLHRQEGGDSEALKPERAPVEPKRALFSIASQRRGAGGRPNGGAGNGSRAAAGEPPAQAKPAPPPAAPAAAPAEEVVDPGPPNVFDEMAVALGQLGGDDPKATAPIVPRAKPVGQRSAGSQHHPPESLRRREERDERREQRPEPREQRPEPRMEHETGGDRPAATAPAPGRLAAAIERVRAAKVAKENRPQSAALRQGGNEPVAARAPAAEAGNGHAPEATPATETAQTGETGDAPAATNGTEAVGRATASARKAAPEPAPEPVIVRPKPPLYTLQQIHERTGIPYSTLSLLAASHAPEIPSAGERYSPAYPLAGLLEFCRIYGEQNPGWEAPPLGPQPGWDDEAGIAARINALEALQSRWSDQLEVEIDRFARPWTGQAEWEV